jgi:hypothetical protein
MVGISRFSKMVSGQFLLSQGMCLVHFFLFDASFDYADKSSLRIQILNLLTHHSLAGPSRLSLLLVFYSPSSPHLSYFSSGENVNGEDSQPGMIKNTRFIIPSLDTAALRETAGVSEGGHMPRPTLPVLAPKEKQ